MRFENVRRSVVKRTSMDDGPAQYREMATVQKLAPFDLSRAPRIAAGDIYHPTHNRPSRRNSGNVKPRKRIRGTLPPHPIAVITVARGIEREGVRLRAKKARAMHKAEKNAKS